MKPMDRFRGGREEVILEPPSPSGTVACLCLPQDPERDVCVCGALIVLGQSCAGQELGSKLSYNPSFFVISPLVGFQNQKIRCLGEDVKKSCKASRRTSLLASSKGCSALFQGEEKRISSWKICTIFGDREVTFGGTREDLMFAVAGLQLPNSM